MTESTTAVNLRNGPRPIGLYVALMLNMSVLKTLMQYHAHHNGTDDPLIQPDDLALFLEGVKKYRAMPQALPTQNYPIAHTIGRVQLVDCGGEGDPIVLIPSMVNKAYVFDLLQEDSMVHHLREAGYHVYYIDWQDPVEHPEHRLSISTAITDVLIPALTWLKDKHGTAPHIHGYCMGGLFAVGTAAYAPQLCRSLSVIAMPWDYSHRQQNPYAGSYNQLYDVFFDSIDHIPADMVQTQFWTLDPLGVIKRLQGFTKVTDPAQLRRMTALEDWLADGMAVESSVAREGMEIWWETNNAAQGKWVLNGKPITPAQLADIPTCVAITTNDIIVPETSSRAFATALDHAHVLEIPAGHVGCMVGRKSNSHFFQPLLEWMGKQA